MSVRPGSDDARVALAFASVGHSFSHLFVLLYATLVLVIEHDWNLPYDQLALLSLPGFVLFGAAALPAGWLADRWSAAGMIAVMFVGLGFSAVATGLATGPAGLLLGLSAIGLFASIYHPVGIAWLVRHARNQGRALGINGIFGSAGTAGAALVAGALADLAGWRAAFIVPGLVCLSVGAAFLWGIRAGWIVDSKVDSVPKPTPERADVWRAFWVLSLTMLMTGLIFQSMAVAMPKAFEERAASLLGNGLTGIGLLVSAVYGLSAITQVIGGELADRFDIRRVYIFAQLATALPLAVAAHVAGWSLVAVALVAVSLNTVGNPAENGLLARYTPAAWRGRAFGAKFVLSFGVSSLGVALVPTIHRLTGSLDALFYVLAGFAATAGIAAIMLPATRRERAPAASAAAAPAE
jgi:MFS family permease